ncbi:MAG: RsmD family RNA methyltransferase [Cyclobacteriaceae bacterium]|nr:RsmD family RNA methyltransferase [Cyclobacteriaceae bacterium]MCH8517272.1 RsmD family RNA methyltransferase [Cyclobacteriaceae bacterium]
MSKFQALYAMREQIKQWVEIPADQLALQLANSNMDADLRQSVVEQVAARRKWKKKLAARAENYEILMPPLLSCEQSSSADTAAFKASIVNKGQSMIDLTAGSGVDFEALMPHFEKVYFVERNQHLVDLAQFNFQARHERISLHATSAEDFLLSWDEEVSLIFLDPDRRPDGQSRQVMLQDCSPNLLELWPKIISIADQVLVKLSPMISIPQVVQALPQLSAVYVLSVKNDCKEVLAYWRKGSEVATQLVAVDLSEGLRLFAHPSKNQKKMPKKATVLAKGAYLYDPDVALLKADLHDAYATQEELQKLHPNTNLFYSDALKSDFMGRVFEIVGEVKPQKKAFRKSFKGDRAGIILKNYGLKPDQLRQQLQLGESDTDFLIGGKVADGKRILLHAKRIK